MAKNLRAIRKRILSIRNTQQITKAMKMVASAKLKRAQDKAVGSRPYLNCLDEVIRMLLAYSADKSFGLLSKRQQEKRVAILLFTSARGLCGAFNSNLIRLAEDMAKSFAHEGKDVSFFNVGKRGYSYFKKRKFGIAKYYEEIRNSIDPDEARAVAKDLVDGFIAGEFDRVVVVYSKFHSAASYKPYFFKLLPVEINNVEEGSSPIIFEPPAYELAEELLPQLVQARILNAILESFASEHGARMTAMEAATTNAGDLLRSMTLDLNKARQAMITQELIEITSSAEAQ